MASSAPEPGTYELDQICKQQRLQFIGAAIFDMAWFLFWFLISILSAKLQPATTKTDQAPFAQNPRQ